VLGLAGPPAHICRIRMCAEYIMPFFVLHGTPASARMSIGWLGSPSSLCSSYPASNETGSGIPDLHLRLGRHTMVFARATTKTYCLCARRPEHLKDQRCSLPHFSAGGPADDIRVRRIAIRRVCPLGAGARGQVTPMVKNMLSRNRFRLTSGEDLAARLLRTGLLRSQQGSHRGFACARTPPRFAVARHCRGVGMAWRPSSSAPAVWPSATTIMPCSMHDSWVALRFAYRWITWEEYHRRPGQSAGAEEKSIARPPTRRAGRRGSAKRA